MELATRVTDNCSTECSASVKISPLSTLGGKWTTYRSMAEETLDAAIKAHDLSAGPSRTVGLMLDGGKDWTPTLYIRLVQDYGLENEVGFET